MPTRSELFEQNLAQALRMSQKYLFLTYGIAFFVLLAVQPPTADDLPLAGSLDLGGEDPAKAGASAQQPAPTPRTIALPATGIELERRSAMAVLVGGFLLGGLLSLWAAVHARRLAGRLADDPNLLEAARTHPSVATMGSRTARLGLVVLPALVLALALSNQSAANEQAWDALWAREFAEWYAEDLPQSSLDGLCTEAALVEARLHAGQDPQAPQTVPHRERLGNGTLDYVDGALWYRIAWSGLAPPGTDGSPVYYLRTMDYPPRVQAFPTSAIHNMTLAFCDPQVASFGTVEFCRLQADAPYAADEVDEFGIPTLDEVPLAARARAGGYCLYNEFLAQRWNENSTRSARLQEQQVFKVPKPSAEALSTVALVSPAHIALAAFLWQPALGKGPKPPASPPDAS